MTFNNAISAKNHAFIFATIAQKTISKFGKQGEYVLSIGVNLYAKQRSRRMMLRAMGDGQALDIKSYMLYGEWFEDAGEELSAEFLSFYPEVNKLVYRCPWYEEWSTNGLLEYGKYYCQDIDIALADGFCGMEPKIAESRAFGGKCCNFLFVNQGVDEADMQIFKQQKELLQNKAKMPWEYHIGHIYKTLGEVIIKAFADAGQQIMTDTIAEYESKFGRAAKDSLLEYLTVDYEILPAYKGIDG